MTALLESLAANEKKQSRAMERFIETLTALVMHYEDEPATVLSAKTRPTSWRNSST